MSCENCENDQEYKFPAYYRWKDADIEIRGCERHIREVMIALDIIQERLVNEKPPKN